MEAGPFEPHPASVGELDRIAGRLHAQGTALTTVGSDTVRGGRWAEAESLGLSTGIRAAVRPADADGGLLAAASAQAGRALSAWAAAVAGYDRTVDELNALWQVARADGFGVGGPQVTAQMSPSQAAQARTDHAGAAGEASRAILAVLERARYVAEGRLDEAAHEVATMLGAGHRPGGGTTLAGGGAATVSPASSGGYSPYDGGGEVTKDAAEDMESRGVGFWDGFDLGEVITFLTMDPAQCVGGEASLGGCGVEIAALLPITKWLKLAKITKYADEVPPPPQTPVGHQGKQIEVPPGTNPPATIGGRRYTGHALDRMQERGFMPTVIDDVVRSNSGVPGRDNTYIHYSPENDISVVVNEFGDVVTVMRSDRRPR